MFHKLLSDFKSHFYKLDPSAKFKLNIGAELEFYYDFEFSLKKKNHKIKEIEDILLKENLIDNLEEEEGDNQFEVHFGIENEPEILIEKINRAKAILIEKNCILTAKPKIDNPGSAIHFNFSLFLDDINLFQKNQRTNEYMIFLYQAIAGMLHFMEESIYIFAPTEECYKRFQGTFQNEQHIHYPMNCSWGFNNRTVAIRVPTIVSKKYPQNRIEHRVCSTVADVKKSLFIILYSIYYGISNFLEPIEPTFGNAFSFENEHITRFPPTLLKAKKLFENSDIRKILENLMNR